jgi:hypothetical protein
LFQMFLLQQQSQLKFQQHWLLSWLGVKCKNSTGCRILCTPPKEAPWPFLNHQS